MKKIMAVTLCSLLLMTGCSSKDDTQNIQTSEDVKVEQASDSNSAEKDAATEASISKEDEKKIMNEFAELKKSDPKPFKIVEFIDSNITSLSPENADKLIFELEGIQTANVEFLYSIFDSEGNSNELYDAFSTYPFKKSDYENIKDEELKTAVKKMFDGGYKLESAEGMIFPIIDYSTLKKYNPYLSQEVRDYIEIQSAESDKMSSRDAAIVVSWDELAKRLAKTEKFLADYPESSKKETIGLLYGLYQSDYFFGSNNTPAFDYENEKIDNEVLKSYKKSVELYKESMFGKSLKKHLENIEGNNLTRSDKILEDARTLINANLDHFQIEKRPFS